MLEWLDATVETASYEAMFYRLTGQGKDGKSTWELFLEIYKGDQKLNAEPYVYYFVDQISYYLDSYVCLHV